MGLAFSARESGAPGATVTPMTPSADAPSSFLGAQDAHPVTTVTLPSRLRAGETAHDAEITIHWPAAPEVSEVGHPPILRVRRVEGQPDQLAVDAVSPPGPVHVYTPGDPVCLPIVLAAGESVTLRAVRRPVDAEFGFPEREFVAVEWDRVPA